MHERYKILEAKFFLGRMDESIGDRAAFRYYLSAFLSAARSVTQYAYEEAKNKGREQWYETTVTKNEVLEFFRNKRNANVHRGEPVDPARHITMAVSEGVFVISAASEVFFNDKPVEMKRPEEEPLPPNPPESRPKNTVLYRFGDWPGSEDLIGSSHRYIEELEKFFQSGVNEGILSG